MDANSHTLRASWKQRLRALKNVPPLLRLVWNSGPPIVGGGALFRLAGALIPLAMLSVSKRILDGVQAHFAGRPLPPAFWYLVAAEFALAVLGSLLGRTIGYFDALLADRFTRHVSIRVME